MLFTLTLLLLTTASQAAEVNLQKVPGIFCASPLFRTPQPWSCQDNRLLSERAEACLAKLNKWEDELGLTAKAIGASGHESQLSQVSTGKSEYAYSLEALAYLRKTAAVAIKELTKYPIYVEFPDGIFEPSISGNDPIAWASSRECVKGNEDRIAAVQSAFAAKVKRYEARFKEASLYKAKLKGQGTDFHSAAPGDQLALRHAASAPVVKKVVQLRKSSTITGEIQSAELR